MKRALVLFILFFFYQGEYLTAQKNKIEEAIFATNDKDPKKREQAAKHLSQYVGQSPQVLTTLFKLLNDSDANVAYTTFESLQKAKHSFDSLKEFCEKSLKSKHEKVQIEALNFLATPQFPKKEDAIKNEIIDWLHSALKGKSSTVSLKAFQVFFQLKEIEEDKKKLLLKELLLGKQKALQIEAIRSIVSFKEKSVEFVPDLITLLKHKDEEIRTLTARTLGQIGPSAKEATTALEEAFKDPKKSVQEEAKFAWSKITETPLESSEKRAEEFLSGRFQQKNYLKEKESKEIEASIQNGLQWLKKHQHQDGFWDADYFTQHCSGNACSSKGQGWGDISVTSLALLAFLGNGHTKESKEFSEVVKKALLFLQKQQDKNGCFGSSESGTRFLYQHMIANLAILEASILHPKEETLQKSAKRGIDFIVSIQNNKPKKLGWHDETQNHESNTIVTTWATFNLVLAKEAGISFPPGALLGAEDWFELVTDPKTFQSSYQTKEARTRKNEKEKSFEHPETMTAATVSAKIFMGTPSRDKILFGGIQRFLKNLPEWKNEDSRNQIDFDYCYYGTLAMFQIGGKEWKTWNEALKKALLETQSKQGCESGSWSPSDAWNVQGGRVYSTAINVLTLETYYRYKKISSLKK